jgi:hypothetical protein
MSEVALCIVCAHKYITQRRLMFPTKPVQGYLAHTKLLPSLDHPRTLVIGLRYGPRGVRIPMGEVPL